MSTNNSLWPTIYPQPWIQPIPVLPVQNIIHNHTTIVNNAPKQTLGDAFKPAKAGAKKSHIVFILDDSGSMQSCREATISGFNEFLLGQKLDAEKTGIETRVSLYKFDGQGVVCTISKEKVQNCEPLNMNTYNPRGGTNLRDAIGSVMQTINSGLASKRKRDRDSVIIVILTDGEENSSRTFTNEDIKTMVLKSESSNWGFMFLGANIDAFAAGSTYGFSSASTIQFNTQHSSSAIKSAGEMSSRMKSAYSAGSNTSAVYASTGFTQEERKSAFDGNK